MWGEGVVAGGGWGAARDDAAISQGVFVLHVLSVSDTMPIARSPCDDGNIVFRNDLSNLPSSKYDASAVTNAGSQ